MEQEQIIGRDKKVGAPLGRLGGVRRARLRGPRHRQPAADPGHRARAAGAPQQPRRRPDPASRLHLHRRHRRPGPPGRRAVLPRVHARRPPAVRADAARARQGRRPQRVHRAHRVGRLRLPARASAPTTTGAPSSSPERVGRCRRPRLRSDDELHGTALGGRRLARPREARRHRRLHHGQPRQAGAAGADVARRRHHHLLAHDHLPATASRCGRSRWSARSPATSPSRARSSRAGSGARQTCARSSRWRWHDIRDHLPVSRIRFGFFEIDAADAEAIRALAVPLRS